jgi:hypothetical protein
VSDCQSFMREHPMAQTQEWDSEEVLVDAIWTRAYRIHQRMPATIMDLARRGYKQAWHQLSLADRLFWWDEACRELGIS